MELFFLNTPAFEDSFCYVTYFARNKVASIRDILLVEKIIKTKINPVRDDTNRRFDKPFL